MAVEELIARTDVDKLPALKNVLKVSGQQGTELGKQPKYNTMIDKAIAERNNAKFGVYNSGQKVASIAITTIEQELGLCCKSAEARAFESASNCAVWLSSLRINQQAEQRQIGLAELKGI